MLLDLTGGVLSLLQMNLLAFNGGKQVHVSSAACVKHNSFSFNVSTSTLLVWLCCYLLYIHRRVYDIVFEFFCSTNYLSGIPSFF